MGRVRVRVAVQRMRYDCTSLPATGTNIVREPLDLDERPKNVGEEMRYCKTKSAELPIATS
eukprot:scaffold170735_cov32-Prasinocladus_malaysianus.AAC.2